MEKSENKPEGTSIIFYNDEHNILLFLRDDTEDIPFPNHWDILGGHVKNGETPKECIIREMKEEIDISLEDPELFGMYYMGDRTEYTFWKKANLKIDDINLHEGQKLKWFSEEEIRAIDSEKIAFNFKKIILEFFRKRPFDTTNRNNGS